MTDTTLDSRKLNSTPDSLSDLTEKQSSPLVPELLRSRSSAEIAPDTRIHQRSSLGEVVLGSTGTSQETRSSQQVRDAYEIAKRPVAIKAASGPIAGMQKWRGRVLDIEEGTFSAELVPIDHDGSMLYADFSVEQLDLDREEVARVGDTFYLAVRTTRVGVRWKTYTTSLRLQRLGRWSVDELNEALEEAKEEWEEFSKFIE